ncbi:MAG TPA: CvpA family protein [bacterium]|nr:CvpA family protein [bacterium]
MEGLFQIIEKIMQSQLWRVVSGHFSWVDWITLAFLLGGLLHGARHGLLRTLVKMAEAFLIVYATFSYQQKVSYQLRAVLPFISGNALPAAGFVALAFSLTFLVILIDSRAAQWFHTSLAGPVRVVGGAMAGIIFGAFLWSFLFQLLLLLPVKSLRESVNRTSFSGKFIKNFAPQIIHKIKL